ncbi:MAG TPA: hypothetical protein VKP04_02190 [Ktedonobacteraceae bacterium]|nr:hypothetical protein [Ktedonobacteraceae bacterium]
MYNDQQGLNGGRAQSPYNNEQDQQLPYDASQQGLNAPQQPLMPGQFLYRDPAANRRGLMPSRQTGNWFQQQSREMQVGLISGSVIFLLIVGFGAAALFGNTPQASGPTYLPTPTTAPTMAPTDTPVPATNTPIPATPTPTPTIAPAQPLVQPTTPPIVPTAVPTQAPTPTAIKPTPTPTKLTPTPVKPTATPKGPPTTPIPTVRPGG